MPASWDDRPLLPLSGRCRPDTNLPGWVAAVRRRRGRPRRSCADSGRSRDRKKRWGNGFVKRSTEPLTLRQARETQASDENLLSLRARHRAMVRLGLVARTRSSYERASPRPLRWAAATILTRTAVESVAGRAMPAQPIRAPPRSGLRARCAMATPVAVRYRMGSNGLNRRARSRAAIAASGSPRSA